MKKEFDVRYNVMNLTSLMEFSYIKGRTGDNSKDVYFYRLLGTKDGFLDEIKKMDDFLGKQMRDNRIVYRRITRLPALTDSQDAQSYTNRYVKWVESGKMVIYTERFQQDAEFGGILGNACRKVSEKYAGMNRQMNDSIEKNLIVKLLYWFDQVLGECVDKWNAGMSVKIVADNICKKQEYMLFYLMTLVGFDVMLIQSRCDIEETADKLGLSKKYSLGEFENITIPEFRLEQSNVEQNPPIVRERQQERERPVINWRRPDRERQTAKQRQMDTERQNVRAKQPHSESAGHYTGDMENEKSYEELAMLATSVVQIAIHDKTGEVIGTGSGIMIGKGGYILTNNHVASGGMYYSVRIEDDEEIYRTDEVIKYNPVLDLAIIRIDRELNPLPVYNGKKGLVRGQRVVAIGSPLGLFNSVSDGIISGFRVIDDVDMIQFTAPTSHGSSGGAVLNMYGQVIGISTAGIDSGQNLNLAMGYECINMFIKGFV